MYCDKQVNLDPTKKLQPQQSVPSPAQSQPNASSGFKLMDFKSGVVKGPSNPNFNYSQLFYYTMNSQVKEHLMNQIRPIN